MYRCKVGLLVLVLVALQLGEAAGKAQGYLKSKFAVQKRNLVQFGFMVQCTTGRYALDFNNYGNFCGYGGGGTPVDEIDRCCKEHDECYGRNEDCSYYMLAYSSAYIKQYRTATQKCVLKCDDTEKCKFNICECDRIAAECFAKYPYNVNHKKSSWWWGKRRLQ